MASITSFGSLFVSSSTSGSGLLVMGDSPYSDVAFEPKAWRLAERRGNDVRVYLLGRAHGRVKSAPDSADTEPASHCSRSSHAKGNTRAAITDACNLAEAVGRWERVVGIGSYGKA